MALVEAVLLCVCLVCLIYYYITREFGRWKGSQTPHLVPTFPFGTFGEWFQQKKNLSVLLREQYNQFSGEKVYGAHRLGAPVLVVRDPEIAKSILVKDFDNFIDRQDKRTHKLWEGGDMDEVW